MKYGMIRAAVISPVLAVADCEFNTKNIIEAMEKAWEDGAEFAVFPELAVTGATCGDLFYQQALLQKAEACLLKIAKETKKVKLVAVVGVPVSVEGKLYSCAAVLCNGRLLALVPKKYPTARQFAPAFEEEMAVNFCGFEVPFGTDILFAHSENSTFVFAAELGEDLMAIHAPSSYHVQAGAAIVVNSAADCELAGRREARRQLVSLQSRKLRCVYLLAEAGAGESSTDLVFSGHDLITENGTVLAEAAPFGEGYACIDVDPEFVLSDRRKSNLFGGIGSKPYRKVFFETEAKTEKFTRKLRKLPFVPENEAECTRRCEEIFELQAMGLYKRLLHTNCQTPVIGISGGLDSTLAILVTAEAMDRLKRDRAQIEAITMPCFGTTKRTKSNAQLLCESLGVSFREVNIAEAVKVHFRDIGQSMDSLDVTFENGQARERTQVLMDIANRKGGMVIGTGDLSELALGWATYNGDHMSMYGVNGSVPKTLIRHLVKWYADKVSDETLKSVLYDILATPVSPELLPAKDGEIAQKTEDLVGPYELHDFFLYYAVRYGFTPKKIRFLAQQAFAGEYADEVIDKWLKNFFRRFFNQQFKRSCLPDGPKVGSISLSPRGDWQMPSDAVSKLWLEELE